MGRVFTSYPVLQTPVVPGYQGPGDIAPGATGWWGLRAYSNATIGTNAIRLRENGGNTEQDFATIAGGGLDLAAIATFKGANTLFVVKEYDQSGNAHDAVQSTAGTQPVFALAFLGPLPAVRYNFINQPSYLVIATGLTVPTPFSLAAVSISDESTAFPSALFGGRNSDAEFRYTVSTLQLLKQNVAGLDGTASLTEQNWNSVFTSYNAATVAFYINGVSTSGGADATGVAAVGPYGLGGGLENNEKHSGTMNEFGVWGSILSGSVAASLSSNQHTYWGY